MVEPLRHRQTKGAATDMFYLMPPRHISTLREAVIDAAVLTINSVDLAPAFSMRMNSFVQRWRCYFDKQVERVTLRTPFNKLRLGFVWPPMAKIKYIT